MLDEVLSIMPEGGNLVAAFTLGLNPEIPPDLAIAQSSLHVIDDQHHFSNVEVPDAFNALLMAGLAQMAPTVR